jgi:chromosome segregation ATPase
MSTIQQSLLSHSTTCAIIPINEYELLKKEHSELKKENSDLKNQIYTLEHNADIFRETISKNKEELEILREENKELKEKLKKLEKDYIEIKKDYSELKQEYLNINDKLNKIENDKLYNKYMIAIQDLNRILELAPKKYIFFKWRNFFSIKIEKKKFRKQKLIIKRF